MNYGPHIILLLLLLIFLTKLHTYIDVPLIVLCFTPLLYFKSAETALDRKFVGLAGILFCLLIYATLISVIYGGEEIIWPLKFGRTLIFFIVLYFFVNKFSERYDYPRFIEIFIICTLINSLIIYCAIAFPEFRQNLYTITGYVPRGPEWSRSPGLTISFNATATVHVTALWFLLVNKNIFNTLQRTVLIALILPSLFFLGRTTSYVGLIIILFHTIVYGTLRIKVISCCVLIAFSLLYFTDLNVEREDTLADRILFNVYHFFSPLQTVGESSGVDKYFSTTLQSQLYLSDDLKTFVFGNSRSGAIGLNVGDYGGETYSDIGVVNSINANGVIATALMYLFYVLIVYHSRFGDWKSVTFLTFLILTNTFKETGFFESHSTPLLFLVYFYQIAARENRLIENADSSYHYRS